MSTRWLAPIAVAVQSYLLWKISDDFPVPLFAIAISASAAAIHRPVSISRQTRWVIAVGLAVIALMKNSLGPPASEMFAADRFDSWSLPLAEYLLLLQALALWRKGEPERGRFVPMLSLAVLVCVLRERYAIINERTLLFAAIAIVVLAALQFAASPTTRSTSAVLRTQARWLQASVLLIAACGAWLLAPAWRSLLMQYEGQWPSLAVNAAGHNPLVRRYVENGSLDSITKAQLEDPRRVALAVYSEVKPGYLRGRVFDTYFRSRWIIGSFPRRRSYGLPITHESPAMPTLPAGVERASDNRHVFVVSPRTSASEQLVPLEIENQPGRGDIYFAPLGTRYLQGSGHVLRMGAHDVVLAGVATGDTYIAHCAPKARSAPPEGSFAERLLQPPLGIEPDVAALAEQVCEGRETTREKIAVVTNFLRRNFRYSTDSSTATGREPLSQFLLERRAGHCEYFASGAIALLRLNGVPCRYATGYVVTEYDDDAECWIARNENAHAWAEAYIAEEQRWVIVEATPGINAPTEPELPAASSVAAVESGGPAATAGAGESWWTFCTSLLTSLNSNLPTFALIVVVVGGVAYWRMHRRNAPLTAQQARFRALHQELRRVDRRVRRRGFTRAAHETLHRFARRLAVAQADNPDAELTQCAAWYERYADQRYRENHP